MDCVNICNFCFQEGLPDIKSVHSYSTEFNTHRIEDIVTKHFWFKTEELVGFVICTTCWNKLSDFHSFYCHVEQLCKQEILEYELFTVKKLEPDPETPVDEIELKNVIIKTEIVDNEDMEENVCDIQQEEKILVLDIKVEPDESEQRKELNIVPVIKAVEHSEKPENRNKEVKRPIVTNEEILLYCQMDCKACSQNFATFKQFKLHYSAVHNQRGYVTCCNSRFYDITRLREHIRVHMDPATFHCSDCKRNFCSKTTLLSHRLLLHLPNDQRSFSCELCPKKFAKQYHLKTHMLTHKTVKDFPCQNCDKQFSSKGALTIHLKNIHRRANEGMCDICSKVLKSRSALTVHRAEHFNTKRILCTTCGKWFKNEISLKKHKIRHQEETKNIVCGTCGKRSPNTHALKKHIQDQHTKGRIHQCSLCDKSFKQALVLKEHMATHTGQQLYSCAYCGKEFRSSGNLHSHRKKAHPDEWQENQKTKQTSPSDV
ncbi:transcription factor grauzone-like [Toxorhynchites rutilus septentrionalis]|uniref:transcription factor grauzone-like n=1 Tax=Toxorhynchites rutilus septentrionalis TaxID=329112 RepID=UPI00247ABF2A|nr:transcription factor grauzone-like [Toxorhynchites rutilus septentrionalis]